MAVRVPLDEPVVPVVFRPSISPDGPGHHVRVVGGGAMLICDCKAASFGNECHAVREIRRLLASGREIADL